MSQTQTRTVCVVRIWHRHGTDIRVANDRVAAYDELFLYVEEHWSDAFGELFPSDSILDQNTAITDYFERRNDEGYEIHENCPITGADEPNRWAIFDFDDETMISNVYADYEECVNDAHRLDNGCIIPMHVNS